MKKIVLAATLALAACGQPAAPKSQTPAAEEPAAVVAPVPAGAGVRVGVREKSAAFDDVSVAQVAPLEAPAKFFSTVGGDPALNGEYVFLALLPDGPDEEAKVFRIGDFNSWSLESQSAGQAVLKVSRSWIDPAGDIKTADERYIVTVPAWAAEEITVTPAK